MKTLGQRIRELREERDVSLRELAKRLGVSAPFLSDVELGRRNPTDKILLSIAKELGVSVIDLKAYDTRPPVDGLRRLTLANPQYGLAFRKVMDTNISAEELIKFVEERSRGKKKS